LGTSVEWKIADWYGRWETKRERPKREWLDNVTEWCNEGIYRTAQDRHVENSSRVCIGHKLVMYQWNNQWMDG